MKSSKGISLLSIIIIFIVLLALVGVTVSLSEYNKEINEKENKTTVEHQECEHEWVITSKYNFWIDSYKTISKCAKCGKEIE